MWSYAKQHPVTSTITAFLCLCSIVGAIFTFSLWRKEVANTHPAIPSSVNRQILFEPYLPQQLPTGYSIQRNSFKVKEDVLIFTAFNENGETITFSEQAAPRSLDLTKFYQDNMINPVRVSTPDSTSIFGKTKDSNNSKILSVVTDHAWIIAALPSSLDKNAATIIAQNLRISD